MFRRAVSLGVLIAAVGFATVAEADPIRRVVLVNSSSELTHAARTALAPWTIEVIEVIEDTRPVDDATVIAIGRARSADRVAWLANDELIVVDPATGVIDRRPAPDGAGAAAAAAAVALSLKTLLRLPPPPTPPTPPPLPTPPPTEPDVIVVPVPAPPAARIQIVPEIGGAVRVAIGGTLGAQPRVAVGLGVAHPAWPRLRPSLIVGFGPAVEAGQSGLQGTWHDLDLAAQLAVMLPLSPTWAIVPRLRLVLHRTHLEGRLPPMDVLDETAYGGELGLDLAVWWRRGPVRAGAGVGAGVWAGLPDYERRNVMVFDSPTVTGLVFGSVLVDL